MITAFVDANIYTGMETLTGKALLTKEERIVGVLPVSEVPEDAAKISLDGFNITPSFIDLQVYGGGGYLFSNAPSPVALQAMTEAVNSTGTSYFLPTLATNSFSIFRQAIQVVKSYQHPSVGGLHLEGPYINPLKKGAHLERFICQPDIKELAQLLDEAGGYIRMMTVAPEMVNSDVIKLLSDHGVLVSAGHSNCTFNEGIKGFEDGISLTTHLFNAMSPMHHRDTGLPGATFLSPHVSASIIADGIHVDYNTVHISKQILKERLFLITDAVEENKEGDYIHFKKADRFTLPDGTLSGSMLTMWQAVKNCVQYCAIDLAEALRMASLYPANVAGRQDRGRLAPGAFADFIVFDQELNLRKIYLHGKPVPVHH